MLWAIIITMFITALFIWIVIRSAFEDLGDDY